MESDDLPELTQEDLLIVLMEECAEVIVAASKCLRFGYSRHHPSYGRNDAVLAEEAGQVIAIIEALNLDPSFLQMGRIGKIRRMREMKKEFGHGQAVDRTEGNARAGNA